MKILSCLTILLITVSCVRQKESKSANVVEHPPSTQVVQKIITKGLPRDFVQRDYTVSRNGATAFTTIQVPGGGRSFILKVDLKTGVPSLAPFSGKYNDMEAMFAQNDSLLLFASDRPLSSRDSTRDFNIWYSKVKKGVISDPIAFDTVINTNGNEYYPSMNNRGDIYFSAHYPGKGHSGIYVSYKTDSGYSHPEILPFEKDGVYHDFNAFVAPDDSYLIFTSMGRKGEKGGGDLFYVQRDRSGNWGEPRPLSQKLNTRGIDFCPFVKNDTLYYTSKRIDESWDTMEFKYLSSLQMHADSVATGEQNIYRTRWKPGE